MCNHKKKKKKKKKKFLWIKTSFTEINEIIFIFKVSNQTKNQRIIFTVKLIWWESSLLPHFHQFFKWPVSQNSVYHPLSVNLKKYLGQF